jgi:hypothetical protein
MGLSISIEVHVPDTIDKNAIIRIGERAYGQDDSGEPMDIGEALQWAFANPQGVTELANLGVHWNAQFQESPTPTADRKAA